MSLAAVEDYEARYDSGPANLDVLLDDASSLVREVAHMVISRVVDEEVALDGDGTSRLYLPNVSVRIPLVALTSVTVDGDVLDPADYRAWPWGGLDRRCGFWPCEPGAVTVAYTHGLDPVPAWLIALVCAMARRAAGRSTSNDFAQGIRSKEIDGFAVSYMGASGLLVGLTPDELATVESLRGLMLA